MTLSAFDLRVRHAVYASFASAAIPAAAAIARVLHARPEEIRDAYERLAGAHVLVLDRESREVRMAIPFSAVPTPFVVESGARRWWANCAWDAFGIPAATGLDAVVTAACGDCGEPMTYRIENGTVSGPSGVVRFAVPAAHWWDDIGYT
jgi:hypothetical protein